MLEQLWKLYFGMLLRSFPASPSFWGFFPFWEWRHQPGWVHQRMWRSWFHACWAQVRLCWTQLKLKSPGTASSATVAMLSLHWSSWEVGTCVGLLALPHQCLHHLSLELSRTAVLPCIQWSVFIHLRTVPALPSFLDLFHFLLQQCLLGLHHGWWTWIRKALCFPFHRAWRVSHYHLVFFSTS